MKRYIRSIAFACLTLTLSAGFSACDDDNVKEFPPKPQQDPEAAPKVVSTMPESDEMSASAGSEITITYDRKIYLTPVTTISVNDEYIDEGITIADDEKTLIIPYTTIPGTKYTVTVANHSVR